MSSMGKLKKRIKDVLVRASAADIRMVEEGIGRRLPAGFVEFYLEYGHGSLEEVSGGCIYSPAELVRDVASPIYFITGSLSPGEQDWATIEEHERLWKTRGAFNPNPGRFTESALTLDGVKLYDCLPVGSNGLCCYHQAIMTGKHAYGLLTSDPSLEGLSADFEAGFLASIQEDLRDDDESD